MPQNRRHRRPCARAKLRGNLLPQIALKDRPPSPPVQGGEAPHNPRGWTKLCARAQTARAQNFAGSLNAPGLPLDLRSGRAVRRFPSAPAQAAVPPRKDKTLNPRAPQPPASPGGFIRFALCVLLVIADSLFGSLVLCRSPVTRHPLPGPRARAAARPQPGRSSAPARGALA
jgi:hypothetical protein